MNSTPHIDAVWLAHRTQRYHTNARLAHIGQTNADHCHGVATIIALLNPDASPHLLRAALLHDAGEWVAGDLPYPFKAAWPNVAELHREAEEALASSITGFEPDLTPMEHDWLKMADGLEAILFAAFHSKGILKRHDWAQFVEGCIRRAGILGCSARVADAIHAMEAEDHL